MHEKFYTIKDNEESQEIYFEGFRIRVDQLIHNNMMPEYYNSPLLCSWEITRACNLQCLHCYNNSGEKNPNELTHEKKIDVAKEIVKAKVLRMCISGGEPVLSKSFWDIAKIFKDGKVVCNTITNGFFIDDLVAKEMSKYFRMVQVSIDGATSETHDKMRGVKGSWDKAIMACKHLRENGVQIDVAFSPSSFNVHEIGKMIDLAYKLGAKCFRTEETKFSGRAVKNKEFLPSTSQYKDFHETISKKRKEYADKLIINDGRDPQKTFVNVITHMPPILCYISPTGVCAPHPTMPYSGGSLKDDKLVDIWDKLKICNKEPDFINTLNNLQSNNDFLNLNNIPYVNGELHDK
jgi:MoaA/NifB/PqqE/SkfB family radical SAM enzyme